MIDRRRLVKIVGRGNVNEDPALLDSYARDISFTGPVTPAKVVKPRTIEEIKPLVNLARETSTPLVCVSSGAPHLRGDTVPGTGGALIVDLSGLRKIIRVDRYHRVAMVETGVTFAELVPAAAREGLRLNLPLLPKQSKSVVASLLEREPVIMPKYQWDNSDPLACLEVIFGTGDDFRTGQAAGPGTIEEQWQAGAVQKAPYGPGPIAWHRFIQGAQGTMGIVTWASLRCELLPQLEEPFMIPAPQPEKLYRVAQWLVRRRLANECFILNRTTLASIMAKRRPAEFKELRSQLSEWLLFFNLAGYAYLPEERIAYQKADVLNCTRELGLDLSRNQGGISAANLLKTVQQPSAEPYWKIRRRGACQEVFFLTNYARLPALIDIMLDQVQKAGYPAAEMGIYIQPGVQGTSCHCEFDLFYDPQDSAETAVVKQINRSAVPALMAGGAFFSRPYGENARLIMNRDAAGVEAITKIRDILDPQHIMNPGKLCF